MRSRQLKTTAALAATAATAGLIAVAAAPAGADDVGLAPLGVYDSGSGDGGSEIVAVDTKSDRMFITNGEADRIDIVDISDPDNPGLVTTFDTSGFGGGIQSVAVGKRLVAAAVDGDSDLDNGTVVTFDVDGNFVAEYEVGNLPDSIAFTPNGRYIVVANEAEPVCSDDLLVADPAGSISIIDVRKDRVSTADFEDWIGQEDALRAEGVRIFFPGSNAAQDLEPEYVTISNNSRTAFVTMQENNAVAVVDIKRAEVVDIVPLGYQDHSVEGTGMDPSNRDDKEEVRTVDVLGMYMPDAIAFADLDAGKFLLTANEGDARDYDCYSEEIRVGDFDSEDDPEEGTEVGGVVAQGLAVPPYAASDIDSDMLGRLKTTTAFPTTLDASDQVDQIYSYGARSFTIWDLAGNVVFDSGDDFQQMLTPTPYFNLDLDDEVEGFEGELVAVTDGRSDDKGSEPEALAIGTVDGRTYAFIGLERSGGIMMYDITDPANATFVDYVNTTTFTSETRTVEDGDVTVDIAGGDISPEGIAFISAAKSPTGEALIAVSFEVSGTTRLFEVG